MSNSLLPDILPAKQDITLRPYQQEAVDAILREWEEARSTLLVLPTGTGKTIAFCSLIPHFPAPIRSLILAPREELIWQAAEKVHLVAGLVPDVEMAEYHAVTGWEKARVVISSIQTQVAGGNGGRMRRFKPDGQHIWTYTIGTDEGITSGGVAVDGYGNTFITGAFEGEINLNAGLGLDYHESVDGFDAFISKIPPEEFDWLLPKYLWD